VQLLAVQRQAGQAAAVCDEACQAGACRQVHLTGAAGSKTTT
jgi:hypothetical protein